MDKVKKSFIEYSDGSYIFLPNYVKILRSIENDIVEILNEVGAYEIMLPKIINNDEIEKLRNIHERFEVELKEEQLSVHNQNGKIGYLAHWQCEPIYFNLDTIFGNIPGDDLKIIYDRSGFSYRNEKYHHIMNLHEFNRIEIIFYGNEFLMRKKMKELQRNLLEYLSLNNPILIKRPEESYDGKEEVVDITMKFGSRDVEVLGSHIHFKTFIDGLLLDTSPNFITGCCGISVSRISLIKHLKEIYSDAEIIEMFEDKTLGKLWG